MWPFNKKIEPVKKKSWDASYDIPAGSFLEYALGGGGTISAQQAMKFYQSSSAIATAVDKISDAIVEIQPVLKIRGTDKYINEHEVLNLLANPNGFETYIEFIKKACNHWLLTHDSHITALGGVMRPPLEIYAVKPQVVSVNQNGDDGYADAYNVTFGPARGDYRRETIKRKTHYLDGGLRELYHIMGFSSRQNDVSGDSPIEAAALEARQQIQGKYHNLALLKNGGRLSLLVNFKDENRIEVDEHNERKKRINEDLAGSDNAGGIAVVSGPEVKITEAGINNKDMDYAKLDKVASESIYLRYKVPLPLVSTDKSTYNNMEKAIFDFYEGTVCTNANIIFAGLSKFLLPRYGVDTSKIKITYNPESIPVIMRQKLIEIKERRAINIETTNELRKLLPNREPLANGGDEVYQPATLVPVGTDAFTDDNFERAEDIENAFNEDDEE